MPSNLAGWLTAHAEYGKLDLDTVFTRQSNIAESGIAISIKNSYFYNNALLGRHPSEETRAVYMPGNKAPTPGTIIKQPLLGRTFRDVVDGGIDRFSRFPREANHRGDHRTRRNPVPRRPRGLLPLLVRADFRRLPRLHNRLSAASMSGFQYLQTFNILEAYDLAASGQNTTNTIHLMAEAMKLSVADRIAYAAREDVPIAGLLDPQYATDRRAMIDPNRAAASEGERYMARHPQGPSPSRRTGALAARRCTTHFDVIDGRGNKSVTQSLGDGFGSGVMLGDTGMMLNNFNYWFDLHPDSPNVIAPRRMFDVHGTLSRAPR